MGGYPFSVLREVNHSPVEIVPCPQDRLKADNRRSVFDSRSAGCAQDEIRSGFAESFTVSPLSERVRLLAGYPNRISIGSESRKASKIAYPNP